MTKKETGFIHSEDPAEMTIAEMQSYIEKTGKESFLREKENFDQRSEAIDFISFHLLDPFEELLRSTKQPAQLLLLKQSAVALKCRLEETDRALFEEIHNAIRAGAYRAEEFKSLVEKYTGFHAAASEEKGRAGYDNLDVFINGLFPVQLMPEQTMEPEPEMVYYQKTPARIVFGFVEQTHIGKEDVFFDLGSGLGQVAILVHLLTGITSKGIEFEPAFCEYANACAKELNLPGVTFINEDARKADYSKGTLFFMFTPFKGKILQEVLARLRKESQSRKIRIITYGPCTAEVALQSWLRATTPGEDNLYKPLVFTSL